MRGDDTRSRGAAADAHVMAVRASVHVPHRPPEGDLGGAGGAIMAMLRCKLRRAAAEPGTQELSAAADPAIEAQWADIPGCRSAPIVVAMVRGAVADERAALARTTAIQHWGGRS